jgi:RimJ/RimL family protein N-acetyltransferase
LGHSEYYPRFGFEIASNKGINAPFDVPDEAFMVIELIRGSLENVQGTVNYFDFNCIKNWRNCMKTIGTERLTLRPLNQRDAERIEELAGDYDVAKTTLNIPHPYPEGGAVEFIDKVLHAEKNGTIIIFAVIDRTTNHLIGLININLTLAHERGELGYWIGKPYWGKGYGTEAAKAILSLGFGTIKLNKIFARAITSNPGSWRIMEKIGMTYEGTLKQHETRWGQYFDIVYYGMLLEDYLE